jgi:nucleoside-diphosphate-sugar epimerase
VGLKIFVAGGTGVLGRASLPALISAGHRVRSTARSRDKEELIRSLGGEAVDCDLYDLKSLRHAIDGSDVVIRLTTKIGSMMSIRDSKAWAETNRLRTEGAHILVDAAIAEGVKAYIHESITFVYADGGTRWVNEDSRLDDGAGEVLRAALTGEREEARFSEAGGRGIVLRFGGFYWADAPSTRETIAMAQKHMLFQIGPGTNYFSSIYVPDAGRAVAAAVTAPAGTYNVCDDQPVLFAEYLKALAAASGSKKPLRMPSFMGRLMFGQVWNYFSRSQKVSNARLKTLAGWRPVVKSVLEGWPLVASELGSTGTHRTSREDKQSAA